ncbi:MAG: hypothetical protein ACW98U_03625 [Candidatus Thorarchaeota archaeon]|jgi:hypothetical protein
MKIVVLIRESDEEESPRNLVRTATTAMIPFRLLVFGGVHVQIKADQ